MQIENLKNCTGCSACFASCSKNAISLVPNEEGFLYPQIDSSKCIQCGLCEKVCPTLNIQHGANKNPKAFAVINDDEKIRMESSSGGVFTAVAKKVIEENGIVFGVKLDEHQKAVFSFTENVEGLSEFRGSKYVQAEMGNAFKECKKFLIENKKVLFTGTPCQIEGLKLFLGKEYENLLTMDIICHGVPSPLVWKKYVEYREKKFASRIVKTAFRRKNGGWKQFSLSFTFANDSEYCAPLIKDPYLRIFLKDVCLRESCYNCPSKKINRVSDITIADFWGIKNFAPEFDDDKGTSLVIVHSKKGEEIFFDLKNCRVKEITLENGLKYNPSMVKSCARPNARDCFFSELENKSFEKVLNKYSKDKVGVRAKVFISKCARKILGDSGVKAVKKMLGK